jgi:hypothetical protein
MLSTRVIMNEWRDVVRLRDASTCIYVDKPAPRLPGSPARAPASLTQPYEP